MEMQKAASEESQLIKREDEEEETPDERKCSQCCRFPTAVYFIIVNEFCERFYYYGMRAILVLYLTQYVGLLAHNAMAIYHTWTALTYLTPLIGGVLADSYFGKYNVILWVSIMYMTGAVVMSVTAIPAPNLTGPVIGLLLVGVGAGGIKACTSAFGGDQIPPEKTKVQESFFSVFYFAINAGSFISTLLTPVFRADVHCFHQSTCYPLAFGFPAILMAIAIIVFVSGRNRYVMKPTTESVFAKSVKCCWHGFRTYWRTRKEVRKVSWIDYANDEYDQSFIDDIKVVGRISLLLLPLLMFWALFDQQSSRWVLQGSLMNGHIIGSIRILPDQMVAVNPVFILLFIPVFESFFYPLVDWLKIPNKPLRRIVAGLLLGCLAYLIAFFLQLKIEHTLPDVPKAGFSKVRLVSLNEGCDLQANLTGLATSSAFSPSKALTLSAGPTTIALVLKCTSGSETKSTVQLNFQSSQSYVLFGWQGKGSKDLNTKLVPKLLLKNRKGLGLVRMIARADSGLSEGIILTAASGRSYSIAARNSSGGLLISPHVRVNPEPYSITIRHRHGNVTALLGKVDIVNGEVVTLLPHGSDASGWKFAFVEEVKGNTISILWQLPQLIVMTAAEILVSITGLSYTYAQAPQSMKATVSALWLITVGLGNLVVAFVAEIEAMPRQSYDYLLFTLLGLFTTFIFIFDAYFYIPNDTTAKTPTAEPDEPKKEDTT